ncbi:MAG: hypothetical protein J5857_08325 [Treponema sp.]|nr:hypothetical protein [Treponema sp.]
MKKKYFIPSLIAGALVLAVTLVSCSNLIVELRGKGIPADFVKISGGTFDGSGTLTPSSSVFIS